MTKRIHPRTRGPWDIPRIERHLAESLLPLRLAVNGASGSPLVLSLWFLPEGTDLWCASHLDSRMIRLLKRHLGCGFEVASDRPPYHGVRGQGRAALLPERGPAVLDALLERYAVDRESRLARFLLSRADQEVAFRVTPERLTSWDYTQRMQGAFAAPSNPSTADSGAA